MKIIRGLKHLNTSLMKTSGRVGVLQPVEVKAAWRLIAAFQDLKEGYKKDGGFLLQELVVIGQGERASN